MQDNNPLVMYLIVKKGLNLSTGKACAQVGHAVAYLMLRYFEIKTSTEGYLFKEWMNSGNHRKVVLGATDNEWVKVKDEFKNDPNVAYVIDAGFTEVAPSTETCIGLWPMYKNDAPKIIKRLQTLK